MSRNARERAAPVCVASPRWLIERPAECAVFENAVRSWVGDYWKNCTCRKLPAHSRDSSCQVFAVCVVCLSAGAASRVVSDPARSLVSNGLSRGWNSRHKLPARSRVASPLPGDRSTTLCRRRRSRGRGRRGGKSRARGSLPTDTGGGISSRLHSLSLALSFSAGSR